MFDPYAGFESVILPNGLTVYNSQIQDRDFEVCGILIHSGSEYDLSGLEGTAHFVEHLISNNAPIDNNELRYFFLDVGGSVTLGSTSWFYTKYSFFIPKDKNILNESFKLFGKMIISANLDKMVERERQVIIEEFRRKYPINFIFELEMLENSILYPNSFISRSTSPLGSIDSINNITQKDLQDFYDNHYVPSNISIVCSGGMDLSEIVEIISLSDFSCFKNKREEPIRDNIFEISPLRINSHSLEVSKYINRDVVKSSSYKTILKIPKSISFYTVMLLKRIFDKILFMEIREKRQWTYHVSSSFVNNKYFYEFSIEAASINPSIIEEVEGVVVECISNVFSNVNLFEKIKRQSILAVCMQDQSVQDLVKKTMNKIIYRGKIFSSKEDIDGYSKVTMSDIISVSKYFAREYRFTLLQKP